MIVEALLGEMGGMKVKTEAKDAGGKAESSRFFLRGSLGFGGGVLFAWASGKNVGACLTFICVRGYKSSFFKAFNFSSRFKVVAIYI
jgi:hypothetical protein